MAFLFRKTGPVWEEQEYVEGQSRETMLCSQVEVYQQAGSFCTRATDLGFGDDEFEK